MNEAEELFKIHLSERCIAFTEQAKLDPQRRFKWDFIVGKLAIEIQGGIWMKKGAHTTGTAITRDCDKSRSAIMNGYIPCYFTSQQVLDGTAIDWLSKYLGVNHREFGK